MNPDILRQALELGPVGKAELTHQVKRRHIRLFVLCAPALFRMYPRSYVLVPWDWRCGEHSSLDAVCYVELCVDAPSKNNCSNWFFDIPLGCPRCLSCIAVLIILAVCVTSAPQPHPFPGFYLLRLLL